MIKLPEKLPALPDQVCTVEQSRELWGLGVRLESVYEWNTYEGAEEITLDGHLVFSNFRPLRNRKYLGTFRAYTVAELGAMLGSWAQDVRYQAGPVNAFQYYTIKTGFGHVYSGIFPTEAQARAGLLIYLLKGGTP